MRLRTPLTVAIFAVFALFGTSAAQVPAPAQFQDLSSIRQQADAGNAQAQFDLGNHYYSGSGVPQDYSQAFFLYRKSADQGYAPAQNQLGSTSGVRRAITSVRKHITSRRQSRAMRQLRAISHIYSRVASP